MGILGEPRRFFNDHQAKFQSHKLLASLAIETYPPSP